MPPPMTRRMRREARGEVMSEAPDFAGLLEGDAEAAKVPGVEGHHDELVQIGRRGKARVLEGRRIALGFGLGEEFSGATRDREVERNAARPVELEHGVDPLLQLSRTAMCAAANELCDAILNFAQRNDAQKGLIAIALEPGRKPRAAAAR